MSSRSEWRKAKHEKTSTGISGFFRDGFRRCRRHRDKLCQKRLPTARFGCQPASLYCISLVCFLIRACRFADEPVGAAKDRPDRPGDHGGGHACAVSELQLCYAIDCLCPGWDRQHHFAGISEPTAHECRRRGSVSFGFDGRPAGEVAGLLPWPGNRRRGLG